MSEAGERLIRSAKQAQAIARGASPDIREKAERLAAAHRNYANDRDGFADLISQALLEAHNAGREEALGSVANAESSMTMAEAAVFIEAVNATYLSDTVRGAVLAGNAMLSKAKSE